jgi:hypothetical protein
MKSGDSAGMVVSPRRRYGCADNIKALTWIVLSGTLSAVASAQTVALCCRFVSD